MNQEVEASLRILCGNNPENWAKTLPDVEFIMNSQVHEATKHTPFELIMGYTPRAYPSILQGTTVPRAEQRLTGLEQLRSEARTALEQSQQRMAIRIKHGLPSYQPGDKVWLEATNLRLEGPSKKLAQKRVGPFQVLKQIGPVAYRLKLPQRYKIHPVFHSSLLSPYRETEAYGPNFPEPPPDLIEGEEEYEVKAILNHKGKGLRRRYLVKWKGYSSGENTWEPEDGLNNAKEILERYKTRTNLRRINGSSINTPRPLRPPVRNIRRSHPHRLALARHPLRHICPPSGAQRLRIPA